MDTIVWDQGFLTGISDVDREHLALVDLFNELSNSLFLVATDHSGMVEETYRKLLEYAAHHFKSEEAHMEECGLDPRHLDMHRSEHKLFFNQLGSLWSMRFSMTNPGEMFLSFLTSWLGLHILGIDKVMARQIGLIQKGASPEEAFDRESVATDPGIQALVKMISNLYHVLSMQNQQLIAAKDRLEARVWERTKELNEANQQLEIVNAQLQHLSQTDGLLQIANRKFFDDRLRELCAGASRRKSPLGLLMIDVDHFKLYNDAYGHQMGDRCLQSVAQAVVKVMARATDLVARYGGEELVVVLPDTDRAGVSEIAARVVSAVADLQIAHVRSPQLGIVTVSVGAVSEIPDGAGGGAALIALADAVLYEAKKAGRNRCITA